MSTIDKAELAEFTPTEVAGMADLARLELSAEELEVIGRDLSAVLDYVAELKKAPVAVGPVATATGPKNVWREDEDPYAPGVFRESLLDAAPKREGDYFKVKKILG
ncbi:MAG: Asp-tRNA(Asn)/Glu-tRNA(Gln) amidotransferase subunit GatC [Patescibacteria group bacterium]|nr:Asp-tRNA(Asn)/Glu-tRNA(Gln) amidotransferase subunit GatC [Patescibacteria group bacterium]